ncbi:hypothetical protein ACIRQP_34315 [Streptomyces sp. NPDC102274]|uniref:cupin domain-containing protein n=1 Tax=Streptomyces sp. NPDC102274 TaxID=3366151 RepID=UPI0037F827C1
MIESTLRTEDVPAAERFDYLRECLAKTVCPHELSCDSDAELRAEIRVIRLGAAVVWPVTVSAPLRLRRSMRMIREFDPEFYHLSLPLRGTLEIAQGDQEAAHGAYDMYVIDTSRPYDFRASAPPEHRLTPAPARPIADGRPSTAGREPDGAMYAVGLEVPKALVPLPVDRTARLLTRRLPGQEGSGPCWRAFSPGWCVRPPPSGPPTGPGWKQS